MFSSSIQSIQGNDIVTFLGISQVIFYYANKNMGASLIILPGLGS